MKILGIDTSTMTGSIGLIDEDRPIAQYSLRIDVTHSERLMEAIDLVLQGARIALEEIDSFAVSVGPGSFTGLRIGLGTIKGLCMATGKPAAAVSTLEALASNMPFCCYLLCPILDARKKEVYTALFQYREDGCLLRLTEDRVVSPRSLSEEIRQPVVFLGDGVDAYKDLLKDQFGDHAYFAPMNAMLPSGISVAMLGLDRLKRGEIISGTDVPVYIRRSEAEVKFGRP